MTVRETLNKVLDEAGGAYLTQHEIFQRCKVIAPLSLGSVSNLLAKDQNTGTVESRWRGRRTYQQGGLAKEYRRWQIESVFLFPNGLVAVTDAAGKQMAGYQGQFADVRDRIERDAPPATRWFGWPGKPESAAISHSLLSRAEKLG